MSQSSSFTGGNDGSCGTGPSGPEVQGDSGAANIHGSLKGVDMNSRAIIRDERNIGLLLDCEESQAFAGMDRGHQCSPPIESRYFGG